MIWYIKYVLHTECVSDIVVCDAFCYMRPLTVCAVNRNSENPFNGFFKALFFAWQANGKIQRFFHSFFTTTTKNMHFRQCDCVTMFQRGNCNRVKILSIFFGA